MHENKNLYCYHCFNKIDPDIIGDYCAECGKKHSVHYSQSEELPAGTYLNNGRYFVGESIGSGGFGITYIGFDTKLEKKILIKETFYNGLFKRNVNNKDNPEPLNVTYGKDFSLERIMQKTKKECKGLSEAEGLNNIVKVYDWFSENNTAYIITEFINGVTLDERVRQKGYYSWEELYKKLKPLMQSLSVLHEKGIIHRDIKPQNIMIKNIKGVGEEFVLIDFGLARFTGTGSMASRGVSFTPGYSPFEQRTFLEQDGDYTDVYALAATIYFALTGQDPNLDLAFTVEENFPKINDLNKYYAVPENITKALKYALNPKYNKRCGSIDELLKLFDGLESVAEDKHIIINKTINSGESSILMKSRDYISANTVNVNSIKGDKDIFKPDEEEYFKFDDDEEDYDDDDEDYYDDEEDYNDDDEDYYDDEEDYDDDDDDDDEEGTFSTKAKVIIGIIIVIFVIAIIGVGIFFLNRGGDEPKKNNTTSQVSDGSVTGIQFKEPSVSIKVGETIPLEIIVEPDSAKDKVLKLKSNDPTIANVDETGKLTGVASGSTTVTATLKSNETITASLIVNVIDDEQNAINIYNEYVNSIVDGSMDIDSEIEQQYDEFGNPIQISNTDSDSNLKVTGNIIRDFNNDGDFELALFCEKLQGGSKIRIFQIEDENAVTEVAEGTELYTTCYEKIETEGASWNTSYVEIKEDESEQAKVTILSSGYEVPTYTYESEDSTIATIDAQGNIKAVKPGTTYIIVTSPLNSNAVAKIKVRVKDDTDLLDDYLAKINKVEQTNDSVFPTKTLTGKAIVDIDNDGMSELLLRFDYSSNVQAVEMVKVENEKCVVYKTYNNLSDLYEYVDNDGSYKNTILVHYTTGKVCMEYRAVVDKDNEKTKNSEQKILSIESGGNLSELINFRTTEKIREQDVTTTYFVNGTHAAQNVYEETLSTYSERYSVWSVWDTVILATDSTKAKDEESTISTPNSNTDGDTDEMSNRRRIY